jgi:hypothetical protein
LISSFEALESVSDDLKVDEDIFECALMAAQASNVESFNERIVFSTAEGDILQVVALG